MHDDSVPNRMQPHKTLSHNRADEATRPTPCAVVFSAKSFTAPLIMTLCSIFPFQISNAPLIIYSNYIILLLQISTKIYSFMGKFVCSTLYQCEMRSIYPFFGGLIILLKIIYVQRNPSTHL